RRHTRSKRDWSSDVCSSDLKSELDFADIKGQSGLKRASEVAAAGGHNILYLGPPGSGKTMAAQRLQTILPDLDARTGMEVTTIRSEERRVGKEVGPAGRGGE